MFVQQDPIYARVLELVARLDDDFLDLASLLRELKDNQPEDFNALIAERFLSRRMAYYLLTVYQTFGDIAQSQRIRLSRIGWTKLIVIAPQVTTKNREKLLKLAEAYKVEDLKAIMRGQAPIIGRKTVTLYLTPKQHEKFAKAILKHGAVQSGDGYAGKEAALIEALRKK